MHGYARGDFADVWARYVPAAPEKSVTSVTSVTSAANPWVVEPGLDSGVTHVTHVTHPSDGRRLCAHCRRPGGTFCEASVGGRPVDLHVGCKDAYRP